MNEVPILSVIAAAKVVNQNNGKKVLFDNTHGQTAGTADWVIDGGFSDFGNGIAKNGYHVKELRKSTPITYEDLKDYNVFIVPEANIPYKKSEQDAMLQYVKNGGSIFNRRRVTNKGSFSKSYFCDSSIWAFCNTTAIINATINSVIPF